MAFYVVYDTNEVNSTCQPVTHMSFQSALCVIDDSLPHNIMTDVDAGVNVCH